MLRKKLDKSSFLHRGTAIPKAMAEMFGNPKETKDVVIQASGKLFEAKVKVFPNGRLQLIWKAEFAKFLQENSLKHLKQSKAAMMMWKCLP